MFQTFALAGVSAEGVISTVFYAAVGVFVMILSLLFINAIFKLDLRQELVEEHNTAFGILLAGVSIALAIIIAAAIV